MKMKWKLLGLMLFSIIALTNCTQEYLSDSKKEKPERMFNFSANLPDAASQTRAANITRYIVEIYKTAEPTVLIKRVEQAGGTIIVSLETNTNYTCLFWADEVAVNDNTNGTFNALDLKNVTLNAGKPMEDAFFARLDITSAATTFNITLRRATAKVNMVATAPVTANTDLKVTYNEYRSFNTFSSDVAGTAVATSKTFNSSATTGTLGTFLTFASVAGILTDVTALYNSTITNEKNNVPLKANYVTNIRGDYTAGAQNFTVVITIDEVWASVIPGVQVNVGTVANPIWLILADRNADKRTETNNAAAPGAGYGVADYGYYYAFSNATDDPTNADKAYQACFDFGEGNGFWRLPTSAEFNTIKNDGKLQWDATESQWKIASDITGANPAFVYLPMAGINNVGHSSTANFGAGAEAAYWCSTAYVRLGIFSNTTSVVADVTGLEHWGFTIRCVRDM